MDKGSEIFYHPQELMIKKGHVVSPTLKSLKKEYILYFEIKPRAISDGLNAILYLATGPSIQEFASGSPYIYLNKVVSKSLQLCMAIHRTALQCVDTAERFPLNTWTNIRISQIKFASAFIFQLSVNENEIFQIKNPHPKTFHNLSVYISDPFHRPLDGSIRNITIKGKYQIVMNATSSLPFTLNINLTWCCLI